MTARERQSGYMLLPHTADVMVSAWGPTAETCLAESVRGMIACFADTRASRPDRTIAFVCDPGPDSELLVELLEEVIFLIDAHDVVPVQVAIARTTEGGLVGEFGVTPLSAVELIGSAPKAVTRHGLRFERLGPTWRSTVVVDV